MIISKKRIISLNFLDELELKDFKIGIQVTDGDFKKLNINEFDEGLLIEPSPSFGQNCARNTNGYSYPDKSKPKENRIINTIEWKWNTWNGEEHSKIVDIWREVYPRIVVPATNVELLLTKNKNNEKFIIANLSDAKDKMMIKQTINMMLEIFGFCEIFTGNLELITSRNNIKRCNWELLPKGIRAKVNEKTKKETKESKRRDFNQLRLDLLTSYEPSETFVGTGGFTGYYAFIYNNSCFLESAIYGNATYIMPKNEWKELSKMPKQEVLLTKKLIDKINHNSDWPTKINLTMRQIEKSNR